MSKMKSMLGLSLMMASLSMANHSHSPQIRNEYLPKETEEQKKKRQKAIDKKINEAKGLTEFFYGENSLWALNQKSADRKARQRHWL
jgi:hypothetical protein